LFVHFLGNENSNSEEKACSVFPGSMSLPFPYLNAGRSAFHPFTSSGIRHPSMQLVRHSANQLLGRSSLQANDQPQALLPQKISSAYSGLSPFSTLSTNLLQPNLLASQNSSGSRLFRFNGYSSSHLLSGLAAAKQCSEEVQNLAKSWALNGLIRDMGNAAVYSGKFQCNTVPMKRPVQEHEATSSGH